MGVSISTAQSASRVNPSQASFNATPPVGVLHVDPNDVNQPPLIKNLPIDSFPVTKKIKQAISDSLVPINDQIEDLTIIVNELATPVNADWNSSTGFSEIFNKPTIPTKTSELTNDAGFLTAEVDGSVTNEIQTLSKTYGNVSLTNGGSVKVPYAVSGTTNTSGNYTYTFLSAYAVAPNVVACIVSPANTRQRIQVTSVTTTSVTVNVFQMNTSFLSLLGLDIINTGVTNVNGANVNLLITEK